MKKVVGLLLALGFLTGCPEEKDLRDIRDGVQAKKTEALKAIASHDFSLEGLLKVQDYFFDFTEKVLLLKEEPEAVKGVQKIIKKNGIDQFCKEFVLPVRDWNTLNQFCTEGGTYKCSPDIKEYPATYQKLKELLGPELAQRFRQEPECR